MNTFESNLKTIQASHPRLADAIREAGGGALLVSPARNGFPTAQQDGRRLHSAYDPLREAETWATEQVRSCRPGEILVVMGVGLLYHAEAHRRHVRCEGLYVVVAAEL